MIERERESWWVVLPIPLGNHCLNYIGELLLLQTLISLPLSAIVANVTDAGIDVCGFFMLQILRFKFLIE